MTSVSPSYRLQLALARRIESKRTPMITTVCKKNWVTTMPSESKVYVKRIPQNLKLKKHTKFCVFFCSDTIYPVDIRHCVSLKKLANNHWYAVKRSM